MSQPERYDILVLGSGTAGKLIAWTMAGEGKRTASIERKVRRRSVSKCRVLAEQEHHSHGESGLVVWAT